MPLYTYECKSCSHAFSANHKIDDRKIPENTLCPECHRLGTVKQTIMGCPEFIYDNRMGAYRTSDNFRDRLIEMKKKAGKDNTINTR